MNIIIDNSDGHLNERELLSAILSIVDDKRSRELDLIDESQLDTAIDHAIAMLQEKLGDVVMWHPDYPGCLIAVDETDAEFLE